MRLSALGLCLLFLFSASYGQKASIKGAIADTSSKTTLANTVVSVLNAKDSILYKFARSKPDGRFEISDMKAGKYLLMITYPTYVDYVDPFSLTDTSNLNFGHISMITKANLLQEVIVQQKVAAIRMRGDTVEFKADSFKVKEGATVEDLLKKLPGLTVDKDGKITAQGEKVEKVLVDGEEFFGDDPTVATKNLSADAVDKVQVFDKKSDQATFTGIDDGQKSRTINLKLKDDKKKGYFGKLDLGGGNNDMWNNTAMINRFRAKQKLSAYGIMSSTGKTGLNWQENNQYGSGNNMEYNDDFGGFVSYGDNDDMGGSNYYGQGLPKSWAAGANYSNKFNEDKQNLNGSYRYNKLNTEGSGNTISQSILPDTTFFTNEARNSVSSKQRHSLNGTYEYNIDSFTSVKVTANGYTGTQNTYSKYLSETNNAKGTLLNKSYRTQSSDGNNQNLKANAIFRKRFKKVGRTVSLSLDEQYSANSSTGYLYADITTFNAGIPKDSLTDQRKVIDTKTSVFNTKVTYTEPLSKKVFTEISYAFRSSTSNSEKLSYNKTPDGKYESLSDTFSNKYRFDVFTNTAGLAFKYNGKKITAGIGSDIAFQNFSQKDLLRDTAFDRTYKNFFPKANFMYKFNANSRININYNGSTRQPSITQIQPIADNTNPLVIYVGNPLLKQEFRHSINFNFNSYKVMSQRGFYIYGNFSTTSNAIVTNQQTDYSTGKTIYQYVNTNGNYNGNTGGGYNMKFTKIDMYFNAGYNFNISKMSNFVNGLQNTTNNVAPGINFSLGKSKEKKFDVWMWSSVNYNMSKSTVNTGLTTNYWTATSNLEGTVYLPWKMEINSEVNANFRQKTSTFDRNNNVVLWNAYIGRKILPKDKGLIKFSAYDLLNQNKGYNRYINSTVVREDNYQTITRYFMLSFVWNFSKNPMGNTPAQ